MIKRTICKRNIMCTLCSNTLIDKDERFVVPALIGMNDDALPNTTVAECVLKFYIEDREV